MIVNLAKLIETLKDLKETRRLSSESEAMIKPFIGLQSELIFSFIESSSTFGSRLGHEFKGGMTVLAQFEDTGLECSILFPKAESEWVKNLTKDEKFTQNVTVLELDNLYQRVVFGKSSQFEREPVENATPALSTNNDSPPELPDAGSQEKLEDPEEVHKRGGEIEALPVVEEPPVLESEITPVTEIEEGKLDAIPDAEFSVEEDLPSSLDEKQEAKEESTVSVILDDELSPDPDEVGTDDPDVSQQDEKKISLLDQGQENSEDQTPPPSPQSSAKKELSKEIQPPPLPKSSRGPVKIDHHYLAELRNKRYEFGVTSLTEKEKAALAQDLKANADSRTKELLRNQAFAKKAGRLFLGIVLITFSLNSCTQGNGTFSLILLGFSVYLLFPYINEILDKEA